VESVVYQKPPLCEIRRPHLVGKCETTHCNQINFISYRRPL